MRICTGNDYLNRLRDGREVWLEGSRVADVTAHPKLKRGATSMASLLDRQHDKTLSVQLSYSEANSEERYAMSFLQPKSMTDVVQRGAAFYDWAKWSNGMMGRTPDYLKCGSGKNCQDNAQRLTC